MRLPGHWVGKYVVYLVDEDGEETDYPREVVCQSEQQLEAKAEVFDAIRMEFIDRTTAIDVAEKDGLGDDFAITIGLVSFDFYRKAN